MYVVVEHLKVFEGTTLTPLRLPMFYVEQQDETIWKSQVTIYFQNSLISVR